MKLAHWSLAALLSLGAACSSDDDGGRGGGDLDGDGDGDGRDGDEDGAGDADGAGDSDGDGQDGICEEVGVRADHTTPDMLIVLDRSGSMGDEGRWEPSRSAVVSVTGQLEAAIRFGLMLFPLDDGGFFPDPSLACADGDLEVPIAINNAAAISERLGQTSPFGGTPTGGSLEAAIGVLEERRNQPDQVPTPQFVLLVSDGQPTCPEGEGFDTAQADIDLATAAIDTLLEQGVKTYVIGYDTQTDSALASVLDEFAQHGGTGEHRAVEDEATLVQEFREIAGEVVSCAFTLENEPQDARYVEVTLDGEKLTINEPDGWTINGRTVTLGGAACETLQDGMEHKLLVQVKCSIVDPL
jgi:hypothetical protein